MSYLHAMAIVQTASPEEVIQRQLSSLAGILRYAATEVPHYAGNSTPAPGSTHLSLDVLQEWPRLEKQVIQRQPETLRSRRLFRTSIKSTGGSTGAPVRIVKDADGLARERAATWMALSWNGVQFGDRVVRFWGTPLTGRRRLSYLASDLAMNRRRLSAFAVDDKAIAGHWDALHRIQPRWIYGYSTVIHRVAEWALQHGRTYMAAPPAVIVPTAEPVSAEMEAAMVAAFGAPVQNEYGCGEVGAIAYACAQGNLHVLTENVVVELLHEDGTAAAEGEVGEVVVTDLTNRAMPLIRYRMGDRARVTGPCTCGLPFPTMGRVEGRARDMISTPRGRKMYGGEIHYHVSAMSELGQCFEQYQFTQVSAEEVVVMLVLTGEVTDEVRERFAKFGREKLDGMSVRVEKVDEIPRAPSGKYFVVQNLHTR